jgi:hypothetical protein
MKLPYRKPRKPEFKKDQPSRVRFGNFTADYTSEPMDYRREQFRWVLIYHLAIALAIIIALTLLAIFAPPWAFVSATGGTVVTTAINHLKGRSP